MTQTNCKESLPKKTHAIAVGQIIELFILILKSDIMTMLSILSIAIGILFLVCGMMLFKYPGYITGMRNLTKEDFELPEVLGAFSSIQKTYLFSGIGIIAIGILSCVFRWTTLYQYTLILLILIPPVNILYQRYRLSTKKRREIFFLIPIILSIALVPCILFYFSQEVSITSDAKQIDISGIYGEQIRTTDILRLELVDTIPSIKTRTNGYAFNGVLIGYFKTTNNKKIKMFLYTTSGPFMKISKKDGHEIYINSKQIETTNKIYAQILAEISPNELSQ